MDWASRIAHFWRRSNTMDSSCCVDELEEAMNQYICPEILRRNREASLLLLYSQKLSIAEALQSAWIKKVVGWKMSLSEGYGKASNMMIFI